MIETGTRAVVIAHVPLAKESRPITRALEFRRKRPERVARACRVIDDAVGVRVLARQEAGPARRAERRRRECVEKPGALARDPVHVRRVDERMAGDAHLVPAHVIHQHHDDVRTTKRVRSTACRRDERCDDRQQSTSIHRALTFRFALFGAGLEVWKEPDPIPRDGA